MSIESSPEKYGLEMVASNDVAGSYEFDMIIVLRDPNTGQLYVAHDSGCSCPEPFGDYGRDDLTPVSGPAGVDAFARSEWEGSYWAKDSPGGLEAAVADLVRGVM